MYMLSGVREEQDPLDPVCTVSQGHTPGLSPGHSTVQVLTYLPFPFLSLPAGTRSLGPSLLCHLLPLLPLRQNLGGQVPLKVMSH